MIFSPLSLSQGFNGHCATQILRQIRRAQKPLTRVKDRTEAAAALLEQHSGVQSLEIKNGTIFATLNFDVLDYSELPILLLESGFNLTLFREEEVNLETAFMELTKGLVQ